MSVLRATNFAAEQGGIQVVGDRAGSQGADNGRASISLQGRAAYRLFEIVQDIKELITALGHEHCILVAHDWGAVAAWRFAAYHSVRVVKVSSASGFLLLSRLVTQNKG